MIPVLHQTDWTRFQPGLERVRHALERLGNPQSVFESILVGGTNGKGTVCWNLARNLGARAGLFLSPHVLDVRERITLSGRWIADHCWQEAYEACSDRGIKDNELSYFEWLFVISCHMFAALQVRTAVFEVGLGGRLDATNALEPALSILTNVGLEHQKHLGNSLEAIALEKIEIMRPGHPFFLPRDLLEIPAVVERINQVGPKLHIFDGDTRQSDANRGMVEQAMTLLGASSRHWSLPVGRRQELSWHGPVWLDGAHNPMAWKDLVRWVKEHFEEPPHLVCMLSGERKPQEMIEILTPCSASVSALDIPFPGALKPTDWPADCPRVSMYQLELGPRPLVFTGSLKGLGAVMEYIEQPR